MHIFMFELSLDNFLEKLLYFLSWEKFKKKEFFELDKLLNIYIVVKMFQVEW